MIGAKRALALPLVFAVAAVLEGGCLLTPREADGPPSEDETPWETPVYPSTVLRNLKNALAYESAGNYGDCFTDDFRFFVDPSDSLDAGEEAEEQYANWTVQDEVTYIQNIFPQAEEIQVTFTLAQDEVEISSDEIYRKDDYELIVYWQTGDIAEEAVYEGTATLYMRRGDTGTWAIYRWVDRRATGAEHATWGVLRGANRG